MKPKSFFYVLLGICGGLVLFGIVGYLYGSKILIAKKEELTKKEAELSLVEERSGQLVELRRHYDDAAKKLDEITKALPESKQQAEVIVALKEVANRTGMNLPTIQFNSNSGIDKKQTDPNYTQTSKVGELYVLPISLKLAGNYDQLIKFLLEVEKLSRYNSVTNLNLTKLSDNKDKLDVSLTINAYLKP